MEDFLSLFGDLIHTVCSTATQDNPHCDTHNHFSPWEILIPCPHCGSKGEESKTCSNAKNANNSTLFSQVDVRGCRQKISHRESVMGTACVHKEEGKGGDQGEIAFPQDFCSSVCYRRLNPSCKSNPNCRDSVPPHVFHENQKDSYFPHEVAATGKFSLTVEKESLIKFAENTMFCPFPPSIKKQGAPFIHKNVL